MGISTSLDANGKSNRWKPMPPFVKICGLTTPDAVDAAIRLGATHIGLVHYEPSQRHVDLATAATLRQRAGSAVKVALLLVNAQPELTGNAIATVRPDIIQFHGRETPDRPDEHTSELQSLMRISYAVFCLKKKNSTPTTQQLQAP